MGRVSRREVAEALNLTRQRVEQYLAAGVFTEDENRRIDLDAARAAYEARVDVVRKAQRETIDDMSGAPPPPAPPAGKVDVPAQKPEAVPSQDGDQPREIYNLARARREKANADLKEIEFAAQSGRLISRDEVAAKEFAVARKVRDRIQGLPARLANWIPPEAMQTVIDECDQLIRELQDDAARIAEQTPH